MVKGIVFIELLMPLAVANVNISSLYNCKPKVVTALVMITSVLFLGIIFIGVELLKYL
jgi:predicted permease